MSIKPALKPIDYELHAKKLGWFKAEDVEDDTLLVVAHDKFNVHYQGPLAWRSAVKYSLNLRTMNLDFEG